MAEYDAFELASNNMMDNAWGTGTSASMANGTYGTNGIGIDPSLNTTTTMGTDLGGILKGGSSILSGISSIAQIGLGFKALGIADDELDIKKDQWDMSKKELQHMQATRKKLTAQYAGKSNQPGSGSAQLAKTDVSAF